MNIVTISRQLGSLGDVVASIVARKKGFKLISADQVHERAMACDPEYSDACSMYETEKGPGLLGRIFFDSPAYNSLFQSLTYEFASEGNVVMMGRGSQFILKDVPGVFRARIVAPTEIRVERIRERQNVSRDEAARLVREHDRRRASLLQAVFEHDLRDWALFDTIINTARYSANGASEALISAYSYLEKAPEPEHLKEKLAAMALAKSIETLIKKRLSSLEAYRVEVSGEPEGQIVISGLIRDQKNKMRCEQIAQEFEGVSSIRNELKVTGLSFGS